ncbi:hypothetical protein ABW19_dt0200486 [Dactylella cylindrospora]|nr:hypothetical protein ABW19_dt0200486 [Dactylella cylindrospora]
MIYLFNRFTELRRTLENRIHPSTTVSQRLFNGIRPSPGNQTYHRLCSGIGILQVDPGSLGLRNGEPSSPPGALGWYPVSQGIPRSGLTISEEILQGTNAEVQPTLPLMQNLCKGQLGVIKAAPRAISGQLKRKRSNSSGADLQSHNNPQLAQGAERESKRRRGRSNGQTYPLFETLSSTLHDGIAAKFGLLFQGEISKSVSQHCSLFA